jgi:hypothetical protein
MEIGSPDGAYDELITVRLDALIQASGLETETAPVDPAETTELLAAHLERVATRALDSLPYERRVAVANARERATTRSSGG